MPRGAGRRGLHPNFLPPGDGCVRASLIAILIGLALTCALPEGRPRRPGALAGLYLALAPSVLQVAWPHADALDHVLPLAEFLAFAALAGAVLTRLPERRAMYTAMLALLAGTGTGM